MARMRYVKPEFWTDGKMVKLSFPARLLFIGMWNFALCDKGHVEDDVLRLKMQIFPADDVDTASLLGELMGSRRVVRLESTNGDTYLHVVHLGDHQKVDPRWTPRCAACKDSPNLSEAPLISPVLTEPLRNSPEPSGTLRNSLQEGIGGEGIGEERRGGGSLFAAFPENAPDEITPRRRPEIRLPATWTPTDAHRAQAAERRCDLAEQVQAFRNHADTNDRRCRNWNSAFTTWLGKSRPSQAPGRGTTDQRVMEHLALADRMQAEDDAQHDRQIGPAA